MKGDSKEHFDSDDKKKTLITINSIDYQISTLFSIEDSENYSIEISKKRDYKHAIAIIVFNKLQEEYGKDCPSLQDIVSEPDDSFTAYICAIVSADSKLKECFNDTDDKLPITQRFGISHESYMGVVAKQIYDSIRPALESYNQLKDSIDFNWITQMQKFVNEMRPAWLDAMDGITQTVQMMAKAMQPYQQLAESISTAISQINIPSVSEEQKEKLKKNYKKWGEIGWSVLPNAPIALCNSFPCNTQAANKLAMKYCNKKSIEALFKKLQHEEIKQVDMEAAIFCYRHRQYKPCVLILFGMMDSLMIKKQPVVPDVRRYVGSGAVKIFNKQLAEKTGEKYSLIIALYQLNLVTCLSTVFANGEDFRKEPPIINRNFVNHGMNVRNVRQRDCIQLFAMLYNLIKFLMYL